MTAKTAKALIPSKAGRYPAAESRDGASTNPALAVIPKGPNQVRLRPFAVNWIQPDHRPSTGAATRHSVILGTTQSNMHGQARLVS